MFVPPMLCSHLTDPGRLEASRTTPSPFSPLTSSASASGTLCESPGSTAGRVGWGGEGIILKDRRAPYRPGLRSPDWLKHKVRLTLEVRVEGGEPELAQWGDWGWAARLRLNYTHPRTGTKATIEEMVRIRQPDSFELRPGRTAQLLCWGVMPSGRLRHPVFLGWR